MAKQSSLSSNCNNVGCTPKCPYFPYMDGVVDWEYNEEGLKVRKKKKIFICSYDGHQITNWTDDCPKMTEQSTKID